MFKFEKVPRAYTTSAQSASAHFSQWNCGHVHARKLPYHWNSDGYFPFSFNVGNTAFHFSLRGASFCVLGMVIFSTELHFGHFGQPISLLDFRFLTYFPSHARSILHVFQGTQGILWVGWVEEYCLLCTAGRGTLDVEDVEDVEDVADVEDVKDVEDRTWRT